MHFAISGHTAAELIYSRANSDKEHMGLTNWKNSPDGLIYKYDVIIAKNYLNEEEMNNLKDLTNLFFVYAEDEAKQRHVMTMKDWIEALDNQIIVHKRKVLIGKGHISHKQAIEKAEKEFEIYRKREMELLESDFDREIKRLRDKNDGNSK